MHRVGTYFTQTGFEHVGLPVEGWQCRRCGGEAYFGPPLRQRWSVRPRFGISRASQGRTVDREGSAPGGCDPTAAIRPRIAEVCDTQGLSAPTSDRRPVICREWGRCLDERPQPERRTDPPQHHRGAPGSISGARRQEVPVRCDGQAATAVGWLLR